MDLWAALSGLWKQPETTVAPDVKAAADGLGLSDATLAKPFDFSTLSKSAPQVSLPGKGGAFRSQLESNPHGLGNTPPAPVQPQITYDEFGQPHDATGKKIEFQDPSLGESLLNIATSPAKLAVGMVTEPIAAASRLPNELNLTGVPELDKQAHQDALSLLMTVTGGNAFNPVRAGEATLASGLMRKADRPTQAASYYNGELFTGATHGDAYAKAVAKYGEDAVDQMILRDGMQDGFVDQSGNFMDRITANEASGGKGLDAYKVLADNGPGFDVWHGSPHDFGKFDLSKIGTGEGAQAYGHGLYFAENPKVAKDYRDKLAEDIFTTGDGKPFSPGSLEHLNVRVAVRKNPSDLQGAIDQAHELLKTASDQTRPMLEGDIEVLKRLQERGGLTSNPGYLYQARVNHDPAHFLDWDKPLSEQHPLRQALLDKTSPLSASEWPGWKKIADDTAKVANEPTLTPERALNALAKVPVNAEEILKNPSAARGVGQSGVSEIMREAGIPGIKYLDGGSRSVGEGSRNYVLFDDSPVDIIHKWRGDQQLFSDTGKANPVGAAVAGAESAFTPTRAYHGTTSAFDKFNRIEGGNALGDAYYFSTSPETASGYALDEANRIAPQGNAGPNVLPVDIDTRKVLSLTDPVKPQDLRRFAEYHNEQVKARNQERGRQTHADELFDPKEFSKSYFDHAFKPTVQNVMQTLDFGPADFKALGYTGLRTGKFAPAWGKGEDIAMFGPGTVKSPLTGETLFSDTGKANPIGGAFAGAMQRAREMGFDPDKVWYHGSNRVDRLTDSKGLKAQRATSGPMPFFTDDPAIASKYATGKADTSIPDDVDMSNYFSISPKSLGWTRSRAPVSVDQSWHFLTPEQKATIKANAHRVGYENIDMGEGPLMLHPEGTEASLNGSHLDDLIRRNGGNVLKGLREMWLESGSLFDDPSQMADIYKLAGYPHPISQSSAPWFDAPGVLPAMLRMSKPLDTGNIAELQALLPKLKDAVKGDRTRLKDERFGADAWDKSTRYTPRSWVEELEKDAAEGKNSFVWTSIPDKITAALKSFGYDGILDTGGKMGGEGHTVAIPFTPEQVRSPFAKFDLKNRDKNGLLLSDTGKASPVGAAISSARTVDDLSKALSDKYGADVRLIDKRGDVHLDNLVVPKEMRGQGVGSQVLADINAWADKNGKRVTLSPATKDDHHGTTSRSRLVKFYQRNGFKENKGRSIDFELGAGKMYRNPKPGAFTND